MASEVALARSLRILARFDDTPPPHFGQQVISNLVSALPPGASDGSPASGRSLKKGDKTMFNDDGWSCKAVVVETLSSTQATIRILEGRLAGEEIEAYFPNGALVSPENYSIMVRRAKTKLRLVGGNALDAD
ncbi:hypothetical protein [Acidisoma silvae]|uniref:Uncharacterized protein n=1 Tax=Acidisoma silvae TaxID=2802396 RepID=A0A963YX15_9PROT|nr:hypothetical protein [Acidisoma silvae]MCB8878409.1 hypothetical protein [Acidisoma silvae]